MQYVPPPLFLFLIPIRRRRLRGTNRLVCAKGQEAEQHTNVGGASNLFLFYFIFEVCMHLSGTFLGICLSWLRQPITMTGRNSLARQAASWTPAVSTRLLSLQEINQQ